MFQFAGSYFTQAMCLPVDDWFFISRVSPFGVLGVIAFCELTLVFVHLRPSSSSCAKASTLRPFFLDWKYCLLFNFYSLLSGSCFLMYRLIIHTISVVVFMPIVLCTLGKTWRPTYHPFAKQMGLGLAGGDKEIRTLDPLRARQVLSQLSYIPMSTIYI